MSDVKEPDSTERNFIEDLCNELKSLPAPTLDNVAERVCRAPSGHQNLALESLLETWFAHPNAKGPVTDHGAAARFFGVLEAVVREAAAAAAANSPGPPVTTIDRSRYTFVQELGRGGFGRVGLFKDESAGRPVAIKLPRQMEETRNNTAAVGKVLDEVRRTCRINSNRVIRFTTSATSWTIILFFATPAFTRRRNGQRS